MTKPRDLRIHKSLGAIAKTASKYALGKMVSYLMRAYNYYQWVNSDLYRFQEDRQPPERIGDLNRYVAESGPVYRNQLTSLTNDDLFEKSSQYYVYKYIESQMAPGDRVVVCDVGAFYAKAGDWFTRKHPGSEVYAIDFGDMETLNANINNPAVKLVSGYPLETLERFEKDGKKDLFDYAVFVRTATLMNVNELSSYMKVLSRISKGVIFLELAKTTSLMRPSLDIAKIPLDKPARVFNGKYIHNYPKLLEKFGFDVDEAHVLPHTAFLGAGANRQFVPDHFFIFAAGTKK